MNSKKLTALCAKVLAPIYAERDWAGECYHVAAEAALALHREETLRVVHGEPLGRGPIAHVGRFGHAWIEVGEGAGRMVFDLTVRLAPFDPEQYYRLGGMGEENVRRYTFAEARALMLETEVYGPWEGGPPPWAKDITDETSFTRQGATDAD